MARQADCVISDNRYARSGSASRTYCPTYNDGVGPACRAGPRTHPLIPDRSTELWPGKPTVRSQPTVTPGPARQAGPTETGPLFAANLAQRRPLMHYLYASKNGVPRRLVATFGSQ